MKRRTILGIIGTDLACKVISPLLHAGKIPVPTKEQPKWEGKIGIVATRKKDGRIEVRLVHPDKINSSRPQVESAFGEFFKNR